MTAQSKPMGLIKRIFGDKDKEGGAPASQPYSTQFRESEGGNEEAQERNASRREMVQVILRDTMRKHGIPSDWMECRIISSTSKSGRTGLHVTIVVKKAHERLLSYVFAFQDSFGRELTRFEPRAFDWLLSVGWAFEGYATPQKGSTMPDPKSWGGMAATSAPAPLADQKVDAVAFPPTVDPRTPRGAAPIVLPSEAEGPDTVTDDVEADLQALFAIRDQALGGNAEAAAPQPDFEPTRPGSDEPDLPPR